MAEARRQGDAFLEEPGAKLIPRVALEELQAATKPSGKVERTAQKLIGGTSALMLGLSPAWAMFQIAAEGSTAAIGG